MAGCGTCGSCRPDHSSKAPQSPSLVNLEVVRSIFSQAVINMMRRHISNAQGELDTEKMLEKDAFLAERTLTLKSVLKIGIRMVWRPF